MMDRYEFKQSTDVSFGTHTAFSDHFLGKRYCGCTFHYALYIIIEQSYSVAVPGNKKRNNNYNNNNQI